GYFVGDLEHPAARLEVVVLPVGAAEAADAGPHARDLLRARRELAAVALIAAVARVEVGVGDAVAFLERPAKRVGLDVGAERVHPARHLVPGNAAGHRHEERRVAAPDVQVGAADAAHADLDDDALRLGRRDLELLDLIALAGAEEYGCASAATHRVSLPCCFRSANPAAQNPSFGAAEYVSTRERTLGSDRLTLSRTRVTRDNGNGQACPSPLRRWQEDDALAGAGGHCTMTWFQRLL